MKTTASFSPSKIIIYSAFLGLMSTLLLTSASQGPGRGPGSGTGGEKGRRLILQAGSFDPAREAPAAGLAHRPPAWGLLNAGDDLNILQFHSEPEETWLGDLESLGVTFFDYVPENAYLARVPVHRMSEVRRSPQIRRVIPYLPGYRVEPDLMTPGDSEEEDEQIRLVIHLTPDIDERDGRADVTAISPQLSITSQGRHPGALIFQVTLPHQDLGPLLPRLAALPDLLWIERHRAASFQNGDMLGILQTGQQSSIRLFDEGLTGSGELIAQADSGLDVDHCFFTDAAEAVSLELIDPDAPPAAPAANAAHRKVLAYQYHAATDTVDGVGHGTHVAGTAAGDNFANLASGSDPGLDLHDGMAPAARLVFQDLDGPGGAEVDAPANLYGYVEAAYNLGARLHTNSWGTDGNTYSDHSSQIDRFTWDHPDMLFLFAAGNYGPDPATVASPGTAKNILTVGMAKSPGVSGQGNSLAPASSKGPTIDGRRKPDVINIGGGPITSAAAGTACGTTDMGGTSMATPGVAGAAALVRQYLVQGFYPHGYPGSGPALLPSAALLKSIIINSAINMTGTGVDAPIPDNSQGWGRVLLDNSLFFPSDDLRLLILRDDDLASASDGFPVAAGTTDTFSLYQCRTDIPLKVTLAWSEPPVAATSGQAWVNDLNLEVEAPDGTTIYLGNDFSGGVSTTGGSADDRNNVEQVLIPAGQVQNGTYTIRVVPATVGVGPQPYALLATGDVSQAPIPQILVSGPVVSGGNDGDEYLDQNETVTMSYTLENTGCGDATGLEAVLIADTMLPVSVTPPLSSIGGLPASAITTVDFQVTMSSAPGTCGALLPLELTLDETPHRWLRKDDLTLELDPASGNRTHLEDMESGDTSFSSAAEWNIAGCRTSSGVASWHMGDLDCKGIPRDSSGHFLRFAIPVAVGEQLSTVSFMHAFDAYSDAGSQDRIHLDIDHDLDGNWDVLDTWLDGEGPATMSLAGPYDLSAFNEGLSATPQFRFRFKSSANWVGGANNVSGWDVDDLEVSMAVSGVCETCSDPPAGDVGDTLLVSTDGSSADLDWTLVVDADSYNILRSQAPDLSGSQTFSASGTSHADPDIPPTGSAFFYRVVSVNSCGTASGY